MSINRLWKEKSPAVLAGLSRWTRSKKGEPLHQTTLPRRFSPARVCKHDYSSAGLIGLLTNGVKSITGISRVNPNPVLKATATCALR